MLEAIAQQASACRIIVNLGRQRSYPKTEFADEFATSFR